MCKKLAERRMEEGVLEKGSIHCQGRIHEYARSDTNVQSWWIRREGKSFQSRGGKEIGGPP